MEKTLSSGSCKLENMVDVINKKCITCNKVRASLNYKDEKQAL